ncbi:MAG: S46 family peptidase, partial [Bacteroidota bacterium]
MAVPLKNTIFVTIIKNHIIMFRKSLIILAAFYLLAILQLRADEGMWIPLLLGKYNIEDMQNKGFRLTAEDIYSVNQACMKDGIVIFGRGCTAELISDKGLIITNHHCGFGQIQNHSSVEHDYLTDGFWAMSDKEELPNPGLTVTFLVRMEDVTGKALEGVSDNASEADRQAAVMKNIKKIESDAVSGTHYEAEVKPFFYGNEYYLFVYEIYRDIRLVGAPPSSIGKFGGDTDNWMWPRHTGDFSLFRIYAGKDNGPADYSTENVPFKPNYHFQISIAGIEKDDFTMVFGYPGRTDEFLPSFAVDQILKKTNPAKIAIREKKLDIINAAMESDKKIRIQYASKAAGIANYWKKWMGESKGLERMDAVKRKQELEKRFTQWIAADPARKTDYAYLLPAYDSLYKAIEPYQLAIDYTHEALFSLDIIDIASNFYDLENFSDDALRERLAALRKTTAGHFNDYDLATDKKLFCEMLRTYFENVDSEFHPDIFAFVGKKFKGDFDKYTDYVFSKTMFGDEQKISEFIDNYSEKSLKILKADPVYLFYESLGKLYTGKILFKWRALKGQIEGMNRMYVQGLMEMQPDKLFYPDANFTMRVTYGKINDYEPADGVQYLYYTTLDGIIEKDNPEIYDYDVPERLKELYNAKDYGHYGVDGTMYVCFTA